MQRYILLMTLTKEGRDMMVQDSNSVLRAEAAAAIRPIAETPRDIGDLEPGRAARWIPVSRRNRSFRLSDICTGLFESRTA